MQMKAVLHVDHGDKGALLSALANIRNLFRQVRPGEASVSLVADGTAVELFQRARPEPYSTDIARLADEGAHFLVCGKSLESLGIPESALLEACRVVPAGIIELVKLQMEGYAYVKP